MASLSGSHSPMNHTTTGSTFTSTGSSLTYILRDYWNESCDPRTVNYWLMHDGPGKLIAITFLYIALVFGGKRFMKNRPAYELKGPMLLYNILMVVVNAYFLFESLVWTRFGLKLLDFKFPSQYDRSAEAMRITWMFYLYQWTKFVDYLDTFFFVLRKKDRQITVLHVYHHISVPFVGWMSSWISPTMPVLGLFAMLNCFCHVIMYSYYALASLGPQIQPYLWWKRYITQVQLTQFAILGVYGFFLNAFHVNYPLAWRMMPITQSAVFLAMFGNFYVQSYLKTKKNNVKRSVTNSDSSSASNGGHLVDNNQNQVTSDKVKVN